MRIFWPTHAGEMLVGLALAAILPTRYRLWGGMGVGELTLLAFAAAVVLLALLRKRFLFSGVLGRIAAAVAIYVFFVQLPLTGVGLYFNVTGVSFRDWLAYALSALFLLACAIGRFDLAVTARYLIGFTVVLICAQFFFGGDSAWYFARFSAGAKNPNQLALYAICGVLFAMVCIEGVVARAVMVGFFVFVGALTRSDALLAAGLATLFAYAACTVLPKRVLVLMSPIMIATLVLSWVSMGDNLSAWVAAEWSGADQGGARSVLYINGLRAWMDTPFTILMGNGAGSFSGLTAAFGEAEAHNTPIDMLAMGGPPGLLVCYVGLFYFLIRAYRHGENAHAAIVVGLIVFSFFHFVARQPLWWFSIAVLAYSVDMRSRKKERG